MRATRCLSIILMQGLLLIGSANAALITVNALTDEPAPGVGVCQLRQAIEAANTDAAVGFCAAGSGSDTIEFRVSGVIDLASDLPEITASLLIDGPGIGRLAINGGGLYRQFHFGWNSGKQQLRSIEIRDGYNSIVGGCVYHEANGLLMDNVLVQGCRAGGGGGGALATTTSIIAGGRSTSILGSTFLDNSADGSGGAISFGNFSGNGSSLEIRDSSFVSNKALGNTSTGGAIRIAAKATDIITILRSTFYDNQADQEGSAINQQTLADAALIIRHSTFSANVADADESGSGNGAISVGEGTLTLENTIVAGNFDLSASSPIPDISIFGNGLVNSNGFNFIGNNRNNDTEFPEGYPNANGDYVGILALPLDPLLGPISSNGGPTPTLVPDDNSPVIDLGSFPGETTDQRGLSNPDTGLRVFDMVPVNADDGCDIGAVEYYSKDIFADSFEDS